MNVEISAQSRGDLPPRQERRIVRRWVQCRFGAGSARDFRTPTGRMGRVYFLRLETGVDIVVKVRPDHPRVAECVRVQRRLFARGFPCPRVLARPGHIDGLILTAEAYRPGGRMLVPGDMGLAERSARRFATLLGTCPAPDEVGSLLDPPPSWIWWNHGHPGLWPPRDDGPEDLNAYPAPPWLTDVAVRARRRLQRDTSPFVVGHSDFEAQNQRYDDDVVYDWDSVVLRRRAQLVGTAAAMYTRHGPLTDATIAETATFLAAFSRTRCRPLSPAELKACWAAGLWIRAYNAMKAIVDERTGRGPSAAPVLDRLRAEKDERLARAAA